jgi:hypothetical protein
MEPFVTPLLRTGFIAMLQRPSPTMTDAASEAEQKSYLFICGAPRSGTTAIAQLLNRHPRIALGIERYKNIGPAGLDEHLFEQQRFFDFRSTDTNVRALATYARLEKKYANAIWLGDKVPRYYTRYDALFEKFSNSVVIFMLRDVHAVAASWNKRAEDPEDTWPEGNDYVQAVREWNDSIELTLEFKQKYRNRLLVVEYEKLFSGDAAVLRRILRRLELEPSKSFLRQFRTTTRNWTDRSQRQFGERDGQSRYIDTHADMKKCAALKRLAVKGTVAQESETIIGAL